MTVLHGDCRETLTTLADCSVDAVVTDPPYGLSSQPDMVEVLTHWLAGDDYHHRTNGFMGKSWDSFVPGPAVWREVFRVLKPGGHLLCFAAPRTYDLMALAVRLAGFEVRDALTWHFASGFPKSLNVSAAIDKAAGAEREVLGYESRHRNRLDSSGWAKSAAPSKRDPRPEGASPGGQLSPVSAPATEDAQRWDGWGTALKPASEIIICARRPLVGTVAANVIAHGTGALNIDATRVGTGDKLVRPPIDRRDNVVFAGGLGVGVQSEPPGRYPPNVVFAHAEQCGPDDTTPCVPGCPVAELDEQGAERGVHGAGHQREHYTLSSAGSVGFGAGFPNGGRYGDDGGPSRFFPTFRYQAKAPRSERPVVNGVRHETVKPLALMRWLVRLVTPPDGGLVLDPFLGSGTTAEACELEGFRWVGCEQNADYLPLIQQRLDRVAAA